MKKGPTFSVWRAPTDNDGIVIPTDSHKLENLWKEFGLDRVIETVSDFAVNRISDSAVQVKVATRAVPDGLELGFSCAYTYTVYGTGDIALTTDVTPDEGLPELPRIGVTMDVPEGYDTFTWYGRGPHESYSDRKESARLGLWSGSVDDQFYPYIMPQETGNKTDVRWSSLTNEAGAGLLVVGDPGESDPFLNVSVFHYDLDNLCAAKHTPDLEKRDYVTLNLDYAQSGLGSASCGPGRLPQYDLMPEPVSFTVRLKAIAGGRDEATSVARISCE